MKVIVNKSVPAPVEPTTYDIVGLSVSQLVIIRDALGPLQWSPERHEIFNAIRTVIGRLP